MDNIKHKNSICKDLQIAWETTLYKVLSDIEYYFYRKFLNI